MDEEKYFVDIDTTMSVIDLAVSNQEESEIAELLRTRPIFGSGPYEILYSPDKKGRARLSISADSKDIEELCARVCTYRPSSLPVSSFVQLITHSYQRGISERTADKSVKMEALFGLAVGELATRLEGGISVDTISFGRLSRTFAYCYAELVSADHKISLEEIWRRWLEARRMLGNDSVQALESEIFGCIGLIEHSAKRGKLQSFSPLVEALVSEHPTDEIILHLQRYSENIDDYLAEFNGPLENRMRAFDKCILNVQRLPIEAIEKSIFIAALANLLQPGSGAYFGMLKFFARNLPGLYLWYGYLSGADSQGVFAENFSAVFRKFLDTVQTKHSETTLRANVDYCELVVLDKAREVASLRRVAEGSFVAINIEDGIIAHVPFASKLEGKSEQDSFDLVPRDHVTKLLSGVAQVLKLGEQLGYKDSIPESDLKRDSRNKSNNGSAKNQKGKQKSIKDEGSLF